MQTALTRLRQFPVGSFVDAHSPSAIGYHRDWDFCKRLGRTTMLCLIRLLVVAIYVSAVGYSTSVSGQSAPARVSDIVVRLINVQQVTPACTPDLEIGFIGLAVPSNQVLLLTGLFWGASSQAGFLVEADIYVTDGNPVNRHNIARVSGTAAANGFFSGIQSFPVPVPLFRGAFTHLCIHNASSAGGAVLGTSTFQIYGFFAPDN